MNPAGDPTEIIQERPDPVFIQDGHEEFMLHLIAGLMVLAVVLAVVLVHGAMQYIQQFLCL